MHQKEKKLIGLHRGFQILDLLSRNPSGLSFGRLQELMDNLPSPTLSRLLKAMSDSGWVVRNYSGQYSAGINFIDAAKRMAGKLNLSEVTAPFVERLALISEESAAFAEFLEDGIVFRAKHEMPFSYHYIHLDSKNSSLANGFNIVSRAYQTDTGNDGAAKKIVREKFYISIEPKLGIRFLAPVFYGPDGGFAGVIGISKIEISINDEEKKFYRKLVEKSALQISKSLSGFKNKN